MCKIHDFPNHAHNKTQTRFFNPLKIQYLQAEFMLLPESSLTHEHIYIINI